MPNIKSAIKRMRQNTKRRTSNRAQRSAFRTEIKKSRVLQAEGNVEGVTAQLPETMSSLDKSANKGLIHKNKAARLISRMMKQANALRQEKASA